MIHHVQDMQDMKLEKVQKARVRSHGLQTGRRVGTQVAPSGWKTSHVH